MPPRTPPRPAVRAVWTLRRALLRAADAVVPPEVAVIEHSMGAGRTAMLAAMAELGLADALAAGPRTAAEVAAARGLDPDVLHRVLRGLVLLGVVRLDHRGRFRLTRAGRTLRTDGDGSLGAWAQYMGSRATREAWAALPGALRTGRPPFAAVHGRSVWAHFAAHPEEERTFASAMRSLSRFDLPAVVAGHPWPQEGTVCDVAGGVGTLLAGILGARPRLRGVLVEAPGVLAEADAFLTRAGVRDRVRTVPGDLFAGVDATADVYVLKDVLHDWDDAACATILAGVRRTMPAGARLVLVERLQDVNDPDPVATMIDLQMLTQCEGGRQRSLGELHALLRGAGLEPAAVRHTAGPALVEAVASA